MYANQDFMYRILSLEDKNQPAWVGWYARAGGILGCYDTEVSARRSAAAHHVKEYQIWKVHAGIPSQNTPYFLPVMVFEKTLPNTNIGQNDDD